MSFIIYTNTISPHQLPLANELVARVGADNFRYIYTEVTDKDHSGLGWTFDTPDWCIHASDAEANDWLEDANTLLSGLRCFNLFERRAKKGLKNFYMTERWFKPPIGMLRLLHPRYFGYARRLSRMVASDELICLPIGVHAARDLDKICRLMQGKSCLDKMRIWGYYVAPSNFDALPVQEASKKSEVRALWVGRLLNWKRVDTIVRAVGEHANWKRVDNSLPTITLDIYGTGPEEARLKRLAAKYGDVIKFYPPVPIYEVRKLMRSHDVYVLASNAYEGWGAVVSEALEECMKVIGTYEAGSSATILPESNLFHSGDWKGLLKLLQKDIPRVSIGDWSARKAVEVIDA